MERINGLSNDQIISHIIRNRNNYYAILFVERTTPVEQIKLHYKRVAVRCHPDKNQSNKDSSEAFKLLNTAHSVLTDKVKRDVYNRNGATGVQRHESHPGGGGGPTARNPYYYQQRQYYPYGGTANSFFEEFFGFTQAPPQARRPQQARRPGATAGPGGIHMEEVDIKGQLMMFVPFLLFLIITLLLQSSMFWSEDGDDGSYGASVSRGREGVYGGAQRGAGGLRFSLTADPQAGFTVERSTSLHGLRVKYFVNRRWDEIIRHKRDLLQATEEQVLRSQRDYLSSRCEAETYLHRSQKKKSVPQVCEEYQKFRKAIG